MTNIERKAFDIRFGNLFSIITFALRITRSHPDILRNSTWILQFICLHGIFTLIFVLLAYCIIFYDLKKDDFTQACANGILCLIFLVVTIDYGILLSYQRVFKDMIEKVDEDYERAKSFTSEEQELILNYVDKGKVVVKLWLWVAVCSAALFPVKSAVLMIYYTVVDEFKFVHLYDLTYPDAVQEVKNDLPVYVVLYILFSFFDLYAMFTILGFSPLGPVFMLHACGQIEIVRNRLINIFDKRNNKAEIEAKLIDIILYLQNIYSFVENIKKSLQLLYELTLKSTVLTVPVALYQVIESFHNGALRLEFISIALGAVALSSIPCYYSDALMESGERLRWTVYMCGWESHWDQRICCLIKLLQLRTSRPLVMRTMFRTVCLNALSEVYQQSYAIFNVLHAAWK